LSSETKRQDGQTYDAWLTVVVNAILHKSGIYCIKLNNRILSLFGSKISKLNSAYKQASKKGSRQVLKLVNTGKQDKKLGHENGPTNNFLSLGWNITKLPHRIELDIPKNRMFFVFRFCYILAGK
jgi:hypothetical protein